MTVDESCVRLYLLLLYICMKYAKCHYTNAAGRTRLVSILISGVSSQPNMYT